MRRSVATAVASRRTVRRCATVAPAREASRWSHYAPYAPRRRNEYDDDDDNDDDDDDNDDDDDDDNDNGYLRPNNMAIFNQNKGRSDHNHTKKIITFKSNNHGGNHFHKRWQSKTDLFRKQFNCEFSHRNKQLYRNRFHRSLPSSPPRRNYSRDNGNFRNSSWVLRESNTGWYAVYVSNVKKCDEVIKVIQCYITPVQLRPYNIHCFNNTNTLIFVVDDFKTAKILLNVNGRIELNHQRLSIRVKHFWPPRVPFVSVSSEVREKMAQEIVNRYNPLTKCLDLSCFHSGQLFTENQLFLPLNHPSFLMAALKIVSEYVKYDLYGLNLKKNYIYLSEGLIWIRRLFPDLKVLDLGENKLTNMKVLESLSGFTIEELNLSMNPLNNTENEENYKKEVQNIFPVLKKLDNLELQSQYRGIVDLKLKMPINIENCYPIPKGHDIKEPNPVITFVDMFLTQFFNLYDNKVSRQLVREAYLDHSIFSLSCDKLLNLSNGNLSQYIPESRNLLILSRKHYRNCFLQRGSKNIFKFLEKLPKTKHDFGSFQIDVPYANSTIVQVVVNGVFAENFEESNSRHDFRSFCRTFCLVPDGRNWRILSDMLFVTAVSNELMIESVKRFNALKPLNKNYYNDNETNNRVMFTEDAEKMYHLESSSSRNPSTSYQEAKFSSSVISQKPSSYQVSPTLQNQQMVTQHYVTSSAAMACQLKLQKTNAMSSTPVLNMTRPPSLKTLFPSPILLNSPLSPTPEMQSTQPPPLTTSFPSSILLSSPSSPTPETQSTQSPSLTTFLPSMFVNCPSSSTNINLDKLTMVKKFSNETGMNIKWAQKCLKENGWNYSLASLSFSKLKSKIPSVAFIT